MTMPRSVNDLWAHSPFRRRYPRLFNGHLMGIISRSQKERGKLDRELREHAMHILSQMDALRRKQQAALQSVSYIGTSESAPS